MKSVLAVSVCLLAGCASMHTDQGDARAAIAAANLEFTTNARAANIERLVNDFYADDAIVMPPNAPAFRGRDNIKQLFTALVGKGVDVTFTTDNVMQSCDMATEIGRYDLGSGPNHQVGKYVVTWRKTNG